MADLQAALDAKEKELQEAIAALDEYTVSSQEIEQELETALTDAETKVDTLTAQVTQLQDQLQQTNRSYERASTETTQVQQKLEQLTKVNEELKVRSHEFEQKIDEYESSIRILETTEKDLQHKLEQAIEDKIFLQTDHEELVKENQILAERMRSEIEDLKSENVALARAGTENKPSVDKDENEKSTKDIELDRLKEKLKTTEKLVGALEAEIDNLTQKLQEEHDKRTAVEQELGNVKEEVLHSAEMEKEIGEMTDELIEKAQIIQKKENELDESFGQNQHLKAELVAAQEKLKYLELQQQQKSTQSVEEQDESMKQLETMKALNKQLEQKELKIKELESNLRHQEVETARITAKIAQTQQKGITEGSDDYQARCRSLQKKNAELLMNIQSITGNIQVLCRVRKIVESSSSSAIANDGFLQVASETELSILDDDSRARPTWRIFKFDRVLAPHETQQDVFQHIEPNLLSVIDGYQACVMAYGPTGSGKTYTMHGTMKSPGITLQLVYRLFEELGHRGEILSEIPEESPMSGYCVQTSVYEIYNDELNDLLGSHEEKLQIRYSKDEGGVSIPNATVRTVTSPSQLLEVLKEGEVRRATASTNVHEHSSRSHSIVQIDVIGAAAKGVVTHGKLYLVDLAGSERVKTSEVSGEQLREAQHINKSLSALGDVMEALDKKKPHIPYRNSKLTYLLQGALGGNARTIMVVTTCPSSTFASETLFALQFASRVRNISTGPLHKNTYLTTRKAQSEIERSQAEIKGMKKHIRQLENALTSAKKEQKLDAEKQHGILTKRTKTLEDLRQNLAAQNKALKTSSTDLGEKYQASQTAYRQVVKEKEEAVRKLRQISSKAKVDRQLLSSLDTQLKNREKEVQRLRVMLQQARRRSTAGIVPRPSSAQSPGRRPLSSPSPSKRNLSSSCSYRSSISSPRKPISETSDENLETRSIGSESACSSVTSSTTERRPRKSFLRPPTVVRR